MEPETNNPLDGGTGIEQAAAAFEALMGGDEPNPRKKDEDERLDEATSEEETSEDEGDDGSGETDDDPEAEEAEEDADADAEEGQEVELPEDALVTVKIDGKEEKIPLKEAIAGYQRQADYSRKTQELAAVRRMVAAEAEAVTTERAQYGVLLQALQTQLVQQGEQEPDWDRLKAEDPLEYTIKREEYRDRQERLYAIQAEQARIMQANQVQQYRQVAEVVEQERSKMIEAIPDFKDAKKADKLRTQLREYGKSIGFSEEDLSQAYDHRAVVALYKAMQYDRMTSKPKAKPVPVERQGPKPMRPSSAVTAPKRLSEAARAKQRLAKTGSIQDAAKLFETLF
jgi:hypothetical protein